MNNPQRGFIVPLLLVIIALLIAGGGAYVFTQQKQQTQSVTSDTALKTDEVAPAQAPTTCIRGRLQNPPVDLPPVITSLSNSSGPIGSVLEIKGCNLAGFEGDLDVTFEKSDGTKVVLTDKFGTYASTQDTLIKVSVKEPCAQGETVVGNYSGVQQKCNYVPLTPGTYKLYTMPWGKKSNEMTFTVTQ